MRTPLPLNSGQSDECKSYWDPPKYEVSPPCLRVCLWASFKRDIGSWFKVQTPTALQSVYLSWELRHIFGRSIWRVYESHDPDFKTRPNPIHSVSKKISFHITDQFHVSANNSSGGVVHITASITEVKRTKRYRGIKRSPFKLLQLLYATAARPRVYLPSQQ